MKARLSLILFHYMTCEYSQILQQGTMPGSVSTCLKSNEEIEQRRKRSNLETLKMITLVPVNHTLLTGKLEPEVQ